MFMTIGFIYLISMVLAGTNTIPTTYMSYVNDGLGFYKVRNLDMPPLNFSYEHRVLNINTGDSVIWRNDAEIDSFTVVSDQNLWNDDVGYIKVDHKINYKFDNPGTYIFHIKEATSNIQTIIVSGTGNAVITPIKKVSPAVTKPISTPTVVKPRKPSPLPTKVATNVPSPMPTAAKERQIPSPTTIEPINANIPVKITPTTIASMAVAVVSIYIMSRTRNKISKR